MNHQHDVRRHLRYEVKSPVSTALLPGPSRFGQMENISQGGLAFRHAFVGGLGSPLSGVDIIPDQSKLSLWDIPCRSVHDTVVEKIDSSKLSQFRIHGIEFGELDQQQQKKLSHFIKQYAKNGFSVTNQVLVMDDDDMLRKVMGKILTRNGYKVGFAANGDEAVELYQRAMESGHCYDAVILDLRVNHGSGGMEAIESIKEIDPDVKAIVSSGNPLDDAISNYQKYGFSSALTKPFDGAQLIKAVSELIMK